MELTYEELSILTDLGTILMLYSYLSRQRQLSEIKCIELDPGDGQREAKNHEPTNTLYVVNELSQIVSPLSASGHRSAFPYVRLRISFLTNSPAEDAFTAVTQVCSNSGFLYVSFRQNTSSISLFNCFSAL